MSYKLDTRPLRVYHDYGDKQGTVLCVAHRNSYFLLNPGAFGTGEYGGTCERCIPTAPHHPSR